MTIYMKVIILVFLLLILTSLASGLTFLFKDMGKGNRLVTSLTVRVALSVTLFLLLIGGFLTGQIQPHGLRF